MEHVEPLGCSNSLSIRGSLGIKKVPSSFSILMRFAAAEIRKKMRQESLEQIRDLQKEEEN